MTSIGVVAMPWAAPDTPSIQIGILTALARDAGLPVVAHSLHLEAAAWFAGLGVDLADFEDIAHRWWNVGLGEWIFTDPQRDPGEYLDYLRGRVPTHAVDVALRLRELVPAFLEHAAGEILAAEPAAVGFTTTFSQTVPSLALAGLLKARRPDLVVLFGGANCDGELGANLYDSFDAVDVVIQGEAEPVFASLCRDILAGHRPTEAVVAAPRASAAEIPPPDYDEYFDRLASSPVRDQIAPRVRLVVETSRGCWWGERHHCTFCGLNGSSMAFRVKPADTVLGEIESLAARYRHSEFDVVDNILDPAFFDDVLPALAARRRAGHDYRFFFETKANLTPERIRLLRDAGVHRIQPGIESLSTPILRRMDKGVTALQNVRLLVFAARYDLMVTWNIIYGIPGETEDDYAAMADLVPSLMHLKPPGLVPLSMQRFSPYFDQPARYGLHLRAPAGYYPHLYPVTPDRLPGLSYAFEHGYDDGYDPERAVAPLRQALEEWDKHWTPGKHRSLRYERGPGYLRLRDRRAGTANRDILLEELESALYLACLAGATPSAAAAIVERDTGVALDPAEVRRFLVDMTDARLMFREGGWFLSLALPLTPDADPPPVLGPTWKLSLAATS